MSLQSYLQFASLFSLGIAIYSESSLAFGTSLFWLLLTGLAFIYNTDK